jgi:hypothetical protein
LPLDFRNRIELCDQNTPNSFALDSTGNSVKKIKMNGERPKQKLPFASEKDSTKFFEEVIRLLIKEFDKRRQKYVPTENFQVFHHGMGWNFQRQEKEGFKPHTGELEKVSTGCEIKLDRIVGNDMAIISDFVLETANRMEEGLVRKLADEMGAVSKETGNTVSIAKDGSLADAFLEIIKKTQAGVSRDGNVSRPTLFLNDPGLIEKLERELIERGPEFRKQIEVARNEQDQQALAREAERLARYDNLE